MNIGIDATCWWNQRGFGRMARELLQAMFAVDSPHQFYLFVDQPPLPEMLRDNTEVIYIRPKKPLTAAAVADDRRSISDMARLYKAVSSAPLDMMFFPAVYSWFPVSPRIPAVVTLHDAIAEHFPEMIFPNWKGRLFWTLKMKLALWQSQRVITVSNAAKNEIVEYIGVKPEIIDVISEAPNALFQQCEKGPSVDLIRQRLGLPQTGELIVYVGGMAPHKNLAGFMRGFAKAQASGQIDNAHLVLVGDYSGAGFHSNYEELDTLAGQVLIKGSVHFTGFISDEELMLLYNAATAAVMPSFSEGFGLPAVEAMACGTPVLSSNLGSLPEVVGDAGVFFDPYSPESMSDAVIKLLTDPGLQSQLGAIAVARAKTFSWERAARLTLSHLEKLDRSGSQ